MIKKYIFVIVLSLLVTAQAFRELHRSNQNNKTVENYCSVKYFDNVSEYKKCKELDTIKLITKITNEVKEDKKEIQLPEIKL